MKQQHQRNLLVFEAPIELTDKTKEIAAQEMCSVSAICRKALNEFIISTDKARQIDQYATY